MTCIEHMTATTATAAAAGLATAIDAATVSGTGAASVRRIPATSRGSGR